MSQRLAIIGDGKMGRAIASLAPERGFEVAAIFGEHGDRDGRALTAEALKGVDVAVEFTMPDAAVGNIRTCLAARVPVVVGTTGWLGMLGTVAQEVAQHDGALLHAANFSLGVNLFIELARDAAQRFSSAPGFSAHLVETHHDQKKDAPSGTALAVAAAMRTGSGADVPVTSIRVGHVPGTHEVIFDGAFEQVRLVHEARDRRVFAEGAIAAAGWIIGRRGVFTMRDVLGLNGATA
jgi:4-hydroxy-tetrahydrodipicolinate reductase